jgi:putative tricarboxylic transport membrane protein
MKAADLTTAAILFLLAGVVLIDALRLGTGWGTDGPQSGFFPFWLALCAMVVTAMIAVQAARRTRPGTFLTRAQALPVLKVLVPAIGLVVAVQFVGLYVASALYLGLSMRWIGRHAWWLVIAVSVAVPLVTFVIFEQWFLVPMPKGPLEAWLGY